MQIRIQDNLEVTAGGGSASEDNLSVKKEYLGVHLKWHWGPLSQLSFFESRGRET